MPGALQEGRLEWGMQLPIQSQSSMYADPWEATAGAPEMRRVALAAEAAGAWYLGVCDHVAIPSHQAEAMGTPWWDTIATLGWLAGVTERVRLLSHVAVLAYRHPLANAKAWSTLDNVSGGRALLGVGVGHVRGEFKLLGLDFTKRGMLLDEAIDAVRAAFAEEFARHDGPQWPFADFGQRPRPLQAGGPPIWVGGSSPAALRRAALRGDGWLPQGPVTQDAVDTIRRHRDEAGLDGPFDIGALIGPVRVGDPPDDLGPCLSGQPEKVAHVLRKLTTLGVKQVQVRFPSTSVDDAVDQIEQFGAEVAPLLND